MGAEPPPVAVVEAEQLPELCVALAIFADLKGLHLVGHSIHVAELAVSAGRLLGLNGGQLTTLRAAALVHDIGRAGVSSEIWDRPAPLGSADIERVRLHPYWTERILARCPALTPLAEIAAAHHERLDGSGYHRRVGSPDLPLSARVVAASDVFAAMTESRPYRTAIPRERAAQALIGEAEAGRLDPRAVAAVIEAAGLPRTRSAWPRGMTDREVEVLRLCARGMTNQEIAQVLVVSGRTVQHHLASIYGKIDRRTRAGAAVFAAEHGMLSPE
jgi:HD-GYP domain-containing protein (c-di-GMP phosphodiesterase class II)